jgi:hypothetical protein
MTRSVIHRRIIFPTIFILVFAAQAFAYLDVPQLDQDQITAVTQYQYICGPTVAAEVVSYWTKNGYPALMNGMPSGDVPDMSQPILDLFLTMADTYSGYDGLYTYADKLAPGIKRYFNDKGYDADVILSAEGTVRLPAIKEEIDTGRPVIMLLLDMDHYVVIIGYTDTPVTLTALVGHVPLLQIFDVSAIPSTHVQTIFVRPQPEAGTAAVIITKSGSGSGSVISTPSGIDCGVDCSEIYSNGTTVTLTANSDADSVFGGWSGMCKGTDPECTVGVNASTPVKATFYLLPRLSLNEGTIGTHLTLTGSDFGTKKGKVLINGLTQKVVTWTPASISVTVKKPPLPAEQAYDVSIHPKPKGAPPINLLGGFTVRKPYVDPDTSSKSGSPASLKGLWFGTKKGKVYVGNQKCKVTSWSMDPSTGEGTIVFEINKKLGTGTYDLEVENKVGKSAPFTFTIGSP